MPRSALAAGIKPGLQHLIPRNNMKPRQRSASNNRTAHLTTKRPLTTGKRHARMGRMASRLHTDMPAP